ncbi:MAG: RDD family protein [Prolixibacteraceae bacterium]|nr:RDD family protein [Prolixibacteraceae bacterium]
MNNKQTPLRLSGVSENIYAGFWIRLGSLFLDTIFILPVVFLTLYLNSRGQYIYFYTIIPSLTFGLWYNIYLPKRYGGTPGKLAVGINIIRFDGGSIDSVICAPILLLVL